LYEAAFRGQALGLRPLSSRRRPEQDEVHLLGRPAPLPRSFERLIRPSYWCATRCD
jgi:hypothetical protein